MYQCIICSTDIYKRFFVLHSDSALMAKVKPYLKCISAMLFHLPSRSTLKIRQLVLFLFLVSFILLIRWHCWKFLKFGFMYIYIYINYRDKRATMVDIAGRSMAEMFDIDPVNL